MTPERWRRVKQILDVSLRLQGHEREQYLARMCESDSELRTEVDSLIQAYEESGDLFEEAPRPQRDPMLGTRIDHYKVVEHIGSGGMGSVYRAVRADDVFYKEVAIKVIRRGLDLEHIVRQFRQERQIMASLEHPNIATVIDGGSTADSLPYFVMEFIRGKPIDVYCNEKNLGVRERLELFRKVCAAVEFAHGHGVIHRDIKPGNILVTESGVPKLLDFGIAKILNPEMTSREAPSTVAPAMTPEYASPEQLVGRPVSEASDVFSLGVLLCELLCARRPYPHAMEFWGDGDPQPPSVLSGRRDLAGDLDNIVLLAVRREPERRYPSARLLGEDIYRYLQGRPVIARKQSIAYRASKFVRRQRAAIISAGAVVVLIAAISVVSNLWTRRNESSLQPQITPVTSLPGKEFQPSFSPDGRKVVYASGGESGGNTDIFVQSLNGGSRFQLTTDPAEDVSPAWSRDGSQIAWLRTGLKETAVFVLPATGGVHRKIADIYSNDRLEAAGRHLDWSPDGKWLAVADKAIPAAPFHIALIAVGDGQKRQVTFPPDKTIGDISPAFSHDGQSIAFIRALGSGMNDVYTAPVAGGLARRITFDNRDVASLAWTGRGNSIVFSSNRRGNISLWSVRDAGRTPVRVPLVSDYATEAAFSRDGRRMVYTQFFDDTNIWRIDAAGRGTPKRLISSTQYDSSPQYSPDGTRIAFRSNRSGASEIWVCDNEGRNPVQLTHFNGPLTGTPRWSPDGREIAFDSRPEGQAKIYAIPAGGGSPRRVTNGPAEDVVPSWSRDGQWIYFASNRSGVWQVWRVRAGGGEEVQVTESGGFAAFESPDGKYLYFAKMRVGPGLWRKRLPAGPEEPVLDRLKPGFWGYWAVVENGIFFADQPPLEKPEIVFYGFAGKRLKSLLTVDKALRVADSAFAVSPDRRWVLYSQVDESGSDILVMDHYREQD